MHTAPSSPAKSKLIGQILVDSKIITADQLEKALAVQALEHGLICTLIVRLGFASAQSVFAALASKLGIEYVDLKKEKIEPAAIEKVPAKLALHYELMPYKFDGKTLVVALADPYDLHKLDDLGLILDIKVETVLSYEKDILDCIHKYYGMGAHILEDIMARPDAQSKMEQRASVVEDMESAVEDASIIKFVNQIFSQAVEERTSDIHMEPYENELRIRFRIDGFLYEVPIPESLKYFHQAIVSRVKIMAQLDIAEHRLPQDGRIQIGVKGEDLDLRVSILPSSFGESVQIRLLSARSFLGLDNLGLLPDNRAKIDTLINRPHGIVFVTGPTGSGKSTTLYASLAQRNAVNTKIITVEDPIEYQMRGITQMQVNPKVGFTFAEGLRSILRHDPDIIMVGEVRDAETADITIRSAMTGHLVFSTLHTNDAAGTPTRLIDMGTESFLAASSLEGVIAQRLVRLICPDCREGKKVPAQLFRQEGVEVKPNEVEVFQGKGCKSCRFTGFKGRTAIFEIMLVDDELRDLIFKRVTSQTIKEKALKAGMRTLRQDGLRKVLEGNTALAEVMRVT